MALVAKLTISAVISIGALVAPILSHASDQKSPDDQIKIKRCNLAAETYLYLKKAIADGIPESEMEKTIEGFALEAGYDQTYAKEKIGQILPVAMKFPFLLRFSEAEVREKQKKRCQAK